MGCCPYSRACPNWPHPHIGRRDTARKPRGCLPILKKVHLLETQGKPPTGRLAPGVGPGPVSNSVCYSEALRTLGDSLHKLCSTGEIDESGCFMTMTAASCSPQSPFNDTAFRPVVSLSCLLSLLSLLSLLFTSLLTSCFTMSPLQRSHQPLI